jgi:hypothetical protein
VTIQAAARKPQGGVSRIPAATAVCFTFLNNE